LASYVYRRAYIDDEGVDLVFNSWGSTATLALQVKSRFTDSLEVRRGDFIADVARSTFQARASYYVLFVVVDPAAVQLGPLWLVPSEALNDRQPTKEKIRFTANIGTAGQGVGKFDEYVVSDLAALPGRLLSILGHLDASAGDF
jgi:hypothetical protein